ncbi:Hypothetical protein PHPALM_37541 [Phytophthora palmivora]|uniref:Uncharacterized protein n=1 Tax=Phytophthora palmivora TaxID=4796 RepID=A0A2P4WX69_9STRA|nr:Hypothetical protein PHPALM_37541 [Phytophthora palmivora]
MLRASFKLRGTVLLALALALAVSATDCNVTESKSASTSASSDELDTTNVGEDDEDEYGGDAGEGEGGDTIFGTLGINGWGHQGCTEEALWCPSLGIPLSRDPKNGCQFPRCP